MPQRIIGNARHRVTNPVRVQVSTTQDIVNAVIAFANGDVSPDPEIFVSFYFHSDGDEKIVAMPTAEDEWNAVSRSEALLETKRIIDLERKRAIEMLAHAAQGSDCLGQRLAEWVNQGERSNIAMQPYLGIDKNRVRLTWVFSRPTAPKGWIYFAAAPATRYCRVEHMREQHRLNSTERTRRARAKKNAEATKGSRRRSK